MKKAKPKIERRSRHAPHTGEMNSLAEGVSGEVESLHEEVQSWYDNMPENLQNGDKGIEVESCAQELDTLKDDCASLFDMIEAIEAINSVEVSYTQDERRSASSRGGRLGNCSRIIDSIESTLESLIADAASAEYKDDLEEAHSQARVVSDGMNNISFPGMY